jgi:hypothetical protein
VRSRLFGLGPILMFSTIVWIGSGCGGRECDRYARITCEKACGCSSTPQCQLSWGTFYNFESRAECERTLHEICEAEVAFEPGSCLEFVESTPCRGSAFEHPNCSLDGATEFGCAPLDTSDPSAGCSCAAGTDQILDECSEASTAGEARCCRQGPSCRCEPVICREDPFLPFYSCECELPRTFTSGDEVSACQTGDDITCCYSAGAATCSCREGLICDADDIEVPSCEPATVSDCPSGREPVAACH